MMLRMIVLARALAGAMALAATPPVAVVEPREDGLGLGRTAAPAAVTAPTAATAPAAASAEHVPSANPLWGIPLQQLSATRQRPLFAPSRRPPPPVVAYQLASAPPPPPPKPSEPEKPRLSLVGTIAGGPEGIGVFQDLASSGSVLRLKMGEGHDGWVLRAVQRREVTLQKGSQTAVLTLPLPEMSKPGLGSPGLAQPGLARPGPAPANRAQGAFPAPAGAGNAGGASLAAPVSNASILSPADPIRDHQTNRR
jgi:general secretion pathway protein N